MWKAIVAGTAALAIAGTSLVYAQRGREEGRERWRPSMEDFRAFGEARLAALNDQEKGDRMAAISALQARRDVSAIPALERFANSDALPNEVRFARATIEILRSANAPKAPAPADDLTQVRNRLAELEKENAELKARLERLEKR